MSHKLGALAALQCYSDSDDEDEGVESCLVNGKDNVVDVDNDVKQCNQPPSKTPVMFFVPPVPMNIANLLFHLGTWLLSCYSSSQM